MNTGKNILIFSDKHEQYKRCHGTYNKSKITVHYFINKCIKLNKKKNSCLDFFLEDAYGINKKTRNNLKGGGKETLDLVHLELLQEDARQLPNGFLVHPNGVVDL